MPTDKYKKRDFWLRDIAILTVTKKYRYLAIDLFLNIPENFKKRRISLWFFLTIESIRSNLIWMNLCSKRIIIIQFECVNLNCAKCTKRNVKFNSVLYQLISLTRCDVNDHSRMSLLYLPKCMMCFKVRRISIVK